MSAATQVGAPSGMACNDINWIDAERYERRLQARIVKAIQGGRHNKAKALRWLLTNSFYGKALAVKRLTEHGCITGCRKMPLRGLSRVR